MKKLYELAENINYLKIIGQIDANVSSICYDSRKCEKDSIFVAIRGTQADGHKFIDSAIKRGSNIIVCEKLPAKLDKYKNRTLILVENSRIALAKLSHARYENPTKDIRVIGVTGTNGKTTVTFLLKSLFEEAGEKTGIIGTTGVYIGNEKIPTTHTTPESLELCSIFSEMRKKSVSTVIMEVSSHALDQHRVEGIEFDAGLFTNLTQDHLDYHASLEEYANIKKHLFDILPKDSIALVNSDDDYSDFMLLNTKTNVKYSVGRNQSSDIIIQNEKLYIDSCEFELNFAGDSFQNAQKGILKLNTNLIGRFNIDNAALAASFANVIGIDNNIIINAIKKSTGAPGRMHKVILKNSAVAIVDYAHTPDALEKALLACRDVLHSAGKSSNKLICVFGCGGDRDKTKRPLMGKISTKIADYTIISNDNPRTEEPDKIIEQIYGSLNMNDKSKTVCITNRAEAIEYAYNFSNKDDIILVAGKGHEEYQIIGTERLHFSDIEELKKYLIHI